MSGLTGNNILAGSSGQAAGYNIDQSLRFENGDSAYLSRTPASAGNRKTWTWSGWVKRGSLDVIEDLFLAKTNSTSDFSIRFNASNQFLIRRRTSAVLDYSSSTSEVYRDVSSWYHIVIAFDTTQSTAADRVKLYINGESVVVSGTFPSLNSDEPVNNTIVHNIGADTINSRYLDGYLAEVNFIDGQALTPASFGKTDLDTNQWVPIKYTGSYGTNGFYLKFQDSSALGDDSSGNTNDFTVTNLAATDQVLDSPTNNFCTINPIDRGSTLTGTFSEGNTRVVINNDLAVRGTIMYPKTGKWYAECLYKDDDKTTEWGFRDLNDFNKGFQVYTSGTVSQLRIRKDNVTVADLSASYPGVNTIYSIAYDADTGDVEAFVNGSSVYSGTLGTVGLDYIPHFLHGSSDPAFYSDIVVNYGQDSSFAGNKTAQNNTDANGIGDFYYTPPSGYLALCEDNLPDPSIALPNEHFNTVLYAGDNTSPRSITGVGFDPEFVWVKNRTSGSYGHYLWDAVRGTDKNLRSDGSFSEAAVSGASNGIVSTNTTDGFITKAGGSGSNNVNGTGSSYVAWNWKAGGTPVSNTDGTITSSVSANPTAGFSIASYTGNATTGATVGHGLSQAPEMLIVKQRDATKNWSVLANSDPTDYLILNGTNATADDVRFWNDTNPSASVFTLGSID